MAKSMKLSALPSRNFKPVRAAIKSELESKVLEIQNKI